MTDTTNRPTAREIADLLRDLEAKRDRAGGWAHEVPADELAAWEDRKRALLERITEHGGAR